jgi:predicted metal-dependent HD superfamily phosphohydrolase
VRDDSGDPFHDIVYDPARSDNEERSKETFETSVCAFPLSAALDDQLVSAMIIATKGHQFREEGNPNDQAINILLKADLSILWHPDPEIYAWYAAGVREEYGFVPEDTFREVRAKILRGLRDDLLQSQQLTSAEAKSLSRNEWELRSWALT